jgi:hypothetical protein
MAADLVADMAAAMAGDVAYETLGSNIYICVKKYRNAIVETF